VLLVEVDRTLEETGCHSINVATVSALFNHPSSVPIKPFVVNQTASDGGAQITIATNDALMQSTLRSFTTARSNGVKIIQAIANNTVNGIRRR